MTRAEDVMEIVMDSLSKRSFAPFFCMLFCSVFYLDQKCLWNQVGKGHSAPLNPNNYDAIFGLGVMFQDFGDYARAARAFDEVLQLNPHHEHAKSALDRLAGRGGPQTL